MSDPIQQQTFEKIKTCTVHDIINVLNFTLTFTLMPMNIDWMQSWFKITGQYHSWSGCSTEHRGSVWLLRKNYSVLSKPWSSMEFFETKDHGIHQLPGFGRICSRSWKWLNAWHSAHSRQSKYFSWCNLQARYGHNLPSRFRSFTWVFFCCFNLVTLRDEKV